MLTISDVVGGVFLFNSQFSVIGLFCYKTGHFFQMFLIFSYSAKNSFKADLRMSTSIGSDRH